MRAIGVPMAIGDACPFCRKPLTRATGVFCWKGTFHDAVRCEPCDAVWPIKGEEIEPLREVSKWRKE